MSPEPAPLRALCRGAVDFAGMFPPARLSLERSVSLFETYRSGEHAWMLNRFVVAASELEALARIPLRGAPLPLSVVCRDASDVEAARASGAAAVETVELLSTPVEGLEVFVERPLPVSRSDLDALRERGAFLKIRLGGSAVPSTPVLAQALANCVQAGIALKATAGLHQALRSSTHGFVNLIVAATAARAGRDVVDLKGILDETEASAFVFDESAVSWRGKRFDVSAIESGRRLLRSFGSCSFEEPVESLHALSKSSR